MKLPFFKALAIVFSLIVVASCKKDPEPQQPDDLNLYLKINYQFDGKDLEKDSIYQLQDGRKVNFKEVYFYLSNIKLKTDTGYYALPLVYHLCSLNKSNYLLGDFKKLNISAIRFDVGVDSVTNAGDPSLFPDTHPLSLHQPISMHWGWNTGYIFALLEGKFDNSAATNELPQTDWVYHIGLNQFLMSNIEIPVSNKDGTLEILFDALGIFRSINVIDENLTTSTFNTALAFKISQNLRSNVFKKVD